MRIRAASARRRISLSCLAPPLTRPHKEGSDLTDAASPKCCETGFYQQKKEAVVAKSKMAVVASPESPQDAAQNVISEPGNQEEISALAYELWIQRGCPLGSPEVDWFRAEEELQRRKGLPAVA